MSFFGSFVLSAIVSWLRAVRTTEVIANGKHGDSKRREKKVEQVVKERNTVEEEDKVESRGGQGE